MKKIWMILLAMLLATGLVVMGCGSSSSDDDDDEFVDWESSGVIIPTAAGDVSPVINTTTGAVTVTAGSSTGFGVPLTGYTYNRSDTLVFEYKIEVEVPSAILNLKTNNTFQGDPSIGNYGNGGGWEYALGDTTRSNYEAGVSLDGAAIVSGTYDDTTKTGTFEVLMRGLNRGTDTVWFQHNYWAQAGGGDTSKIAEDSKYTVTFTKIYNVRGEAIEEEGEEDPEEEVAPTFKITVDGNAVEVTAIGYETDDPDKTPDVDLNGLADDDGNVIGYIYNIENYGWDSYAYFKADLGAGNKLSDFESVTVTVTSAGTDPNYKMFYLWASADGAFDAGSGGAASAVAGVANEGQTWNFSSGTQTLTLDLYTDASVDAIAGTSNEVYLTFYLSTSSARLTISGISLNK